MRGVDPSDRRWVVSTALALTVTFVGLGWILHGSLRAREHAELQSALETVLAASNENLQIWGEECMAELQLTARDPALRRMAAELASQSGEPEGLLASSAMRDMREYFRVRQQSWGREGFVLIQADGVVLGSMHDELVGMTSVIARERPELFARALAGETVFVPPLWSEVPLAGSDGRIVPRVATMFFITPLGEGYPSMVLAQRLKPQDTFSRLVLASRLGATGETYCVDRNGMMVTGSRFAERLSAVGAISDDNAGILSIPIRDPGVNLMKDAGTESVWKGRPQTALAAGLLANRPGVNLAGYRDYRGAQVVGAWRWNPLLDVGVATEIDQSEGMAGFYSAALAVWFAMGVALAASLTALVVNARASGRHAQTLRAARDGLDREVRARTLELENARAQAEAVSQAKGAFLANVSHEFRTPMNAIMGLTELMLKESMPPLHRQHLEVIRRSGQGLLRLITDVLDFSKLESGNLEIRSEPMLLRDIVDDAVGLFERTCRDKEVALLLWLDESCPERVVGDGERLKQVLVNVIGNAVKFTEAGWIEVRVSSRLTAGGRTELSFSVADTGIGVSAEREGHIFEAFKQGDAEVARQYGGTGLGLSISRQLVGLMGGRMWYERRSMTGQGSVFAFTVVVDAEKESPPSIASSTRKGIAKMRILVAEDSLANQRVLVAALRSFGHEVVAVRDGTDAVSIVCEAAQCFDLVLMDDQMLKMNGPEATRRIRDFESAQRLARIPIVVVTARDIDAERGAYLAAGMDDCLAKPIDRKALVRILDQFAEDIARRRRSSGEPTPSAEFAALDAATARLVIVDLDQAEAMLSDAVNKRDVAGVRAAAHALISLLGTFYSLESGDRARRLSSLPEDGFWAAADPILAAVAADVDAFYRLLNQSKKPISRD